MCGPTSGEQIYTCRQGAGSNEPEDDMYTNASVKAEVDYRRERLSRDFRQHRTSTRGRRTISHLFGRKA